uniref:Uncharacterized protein n=1 Tax=Chenopodium quinoa TaxID=63459 RepID=A0A803LM31_CHEQI
MLSNGPYGENTASGYVFTTTDAVNQWVGEETNYDHNLNVCLNGKECTHHDTEQEVELDDEHPHHEDGPSPRRPREATP